MTTKSEPSDWRALSRLAAKLQTSGQPVTMVVGRKPPSEPIATDEVGGEAVCRSSDDFDGFEGVITGDGTRHPIKG